MDGMAAGAAFIRSPEALDAAQAFIRDPLRGPVAPHVRTLASLADVELQAFDAVFIPGGNAVMADLWHDEDLGRLLRHFHEQGKLTAAICNGAASLVSTNRTGAWPYAGYRMTAFSNAEWRTLQPPALAEALPHAETLLRANGATMDLGWPASSHVVQDRELLTGQNPFSTGAFTKRLLSGLQEQCKGTPAAQGAA